MLVMNTHYGLPEELPFDLKERRYPICYQLEPEADDKPSKRESLQSIFHTAMEVVIRTGLKPYLRYAYKGFERPGNPFFPTLEELKTDQAKTFVERLELAKRKVYDDWIRCRPPHEQGRFHRINDYAFRIFRDLCFIQERWHSLHRRYFQGLRTMRDPPSYKNDARVEIEFGPHYQLDHWSDLGYADEFAPVQIVCDQYVGPRGDGFNVFARVKIRDRVWQIAMYFGAEADDQPPSFVWIEMPRPPELPPL